MAEEQSNSTRFALLHKTLWCEIWMSSVSHRERENVTLKMYWPTDQITHDDSEISPVIHNQRWRIILPLWECHFLFCFNQPANYQSAAEWNRIWHSHIATEQVTSMITTTEQTTDADDNEKSERERDEWCSEPHHRRTDLEFKMILYETDHIYSWLFKKYASFF